MTQEWLKEYFDYSPSGTLTCRKAHHMRPVGRVLDGCIHTSGRAVVRVKNRVWQIHRLIYLWHYGEVPSVVLHKNGNLRDNRIENLKGIKNEKT